MQSKAFLLAVLLPIALLVSVAVGLGGGLQRAARPKLGRLADAPATLPSAADLAPHAANDAANHAAPCPWSNTAGERVGPPRGFDSRGRHIYRRSGRRWRPRGAQLLELATCQTPDARPDLAELKRAADRLLGRGVNLLRIPLEPWQNAGAWSNPDDAAALLDLVAHITQRPGVAVLLTATTEQPAAGNADDLPRQQAFWHEVVDLFAQQPQVIFDLSSSQQAGTRPPCEAGVARNLNALLHAIRTRERALNVPMHLVAVQGNTPSKNNRGRDDSQGTTLPAAKAGNVVWVGERPSYALRGAGSLYLSPAR